MKIATPKLNFKIPSNFSFSLRDYFTYPSLLFVVLFFFPIKIVPAAVLLLALISIIGNKFRFELHFTKSLLILSSLLIAVVLASSIVNRIHISSIFYFLYFHLAPFSAVFLFGNLKIQNLKNILKSLQGLVFLQFVLIPISFIVNKLGSATDDWYAGTISAAGKNQDITGFVMMMSCLFFYAIPDKYLNYKKVTIFFCICCWIATNTFKTYPLFILALIASLLITNFKGFFSLKLIAYSTISIGASIAVIYVIAKRSLLNLLYMFLGGRIWELGKLWGPILAINYFFRNPAESIVGLGPGSTASRVALFKEYYGKSLPLLDSKLSGFYTDLTALISTGGSSIDTPFSSAIGIFLELGILGLIIYVAYFILLFQAIYNCKSHFTKNQLTAFITLLFSFLISNGLENNIDNAKIHTFFVGYVIILLILKNKTLELTQTYDLEQRKTANG